MPEKFERFTEEARKVFFFAQEEARSFNHNNIGTEHLLVGLLRQETGVAARVLLGLSVQLPQVRSAVEFIIGRGDGFVVGDPGLTPRATRVIELAMDEARRLQSGRIGTEHLLLGLVREGEGIAAGVLESLGVSLDTVRARTLAMIEAAPPAQTSPSSSPAEPPVYGVTLPPETAARLHATSEATGRTLNDVILEAITKTWLQDAPDAPDSPSYT